MAPCMAAIDYGKKQGRVEAGFSHVPERMCDKERKRASRRTVSAAPGRFVVVVNIGVIIKEM